MLEKVIEILKEFVEVPQEKIVPEAKLLSDLGLSSLDVINVVLVFEETFDIEIPDRKLTEITTVNDIMQLLQEEYGK